MKQFLSIVIFLAIRPPSYTIRTEKKEGSEMCAHIIITEKKCKSLNYIWKQNLKRFFGI